jgi:very-short-patch-repair endonuclease
MNREFLAAWRELLDRQAGVVSRAQAIDDGSLGDEAIGYRLATGRWRTVHRGVYATFTSELSREAVLWAAVLRAGPGAALSHQTAAELLGLADVRSDVIHLSVPLGRHPESIQGAVVHRSVRIAAAIHPVQLPPRTRIEETAIDLTQTAASADAAFGWLSRAVGRRLTTTALLRAALAERPKVRRRAELLVALSDVGEGAHSVLERRYVRDVERAHGLPVADRQVRVILDGRSHYLDNCYQAIGLAIELDGQVAHAVEQRWADMRRDNLHAAAGILTLRYSWTDVTERPCLVASQIAAVMRERGAPVILRPCGPACITRTRNRQRAS